MDKPNQFLEAALAYAAGGVPVFPCKPTDKRPLTAHGFKDATTDTVVIQDWWRRWPDALIGMPTGRKSGIVVLDVDVDTAKQKDGEAALRDLLTRHKATLPDTRIVQTPRGGRHLHFAHPGGGIKVTTRTDWPANALDVRGDGGYVILPPSVAQNGAYSWISEVAVAPIPVWLSELLIAAPKPKAQSKVPALQGGDIQAVRDALTFIPAANRTIWRNIGFALKAGLGEAAGWQVFDEWSRKAPEHYSEAENQRQWESFKPDGGITLGTLFHIAKQHGWQGGPKPSIATDEAAELARLAALSPLDYDRERQSSAERLGVRVGALDAEVAKRRNAASGVQGGAVEFAAVEPWPEPVDGAAVLDAVAEVFAHYVALPPHAADALALWTAHAHAYQSFIHTPRLNLRSPEKGCGKTTLLDVLAALVPRPLRTESITPAVLFRLVEAHRPVLLLDEVDTYLRDNEELRGLLNAGHKCGAKAYRCEGDRNEVRAFAAFAPAALAGIGELPGTLHDRSLVVRLVRAKPGEVPARFDSRRTAAETLVCRQLARWTADAAPQLESLDPALPESAFNRLADNWRPLFAIAHAAGGDWPARAEAAFNTLTTGDDLDAHGLGTTLLADIRDAFTAARVDRLASARLAETLADIEGRPWAEFGKSRRPISANQLARLLRPFGISSRNIRVGDNTPKGYMLDDFTEAFERYLPTLPPLSNSHTATSPENVEDSSHPDTPQPERAWRIEDADPPNEIKGCGGVADAVPPAEVLHV